MPRKLLRRWLPDHHKVREHPHLRRFGQRLTDPNLWHLNRRSAAAATAVGLFVAFIPVPAQMLIAASLAIACRVNLPISVALVWVTNPITMPPVLYVTYRLGCRLLGIDPGSPHFDLSLDTLAGLLHIWEPLLLGSLVAGTVLAVLGYWIVRGLWSLHVRHHWSRVRRMRVRPAAPVPAATPDPSAPRAQDHA